MHNDRGAPFCETQALCIFVRGDGVAQTHKGCDLRIFGCQGSDCVFRFESSAGWLAPLVDLLKALGRKRVTCGDAYLMATPKLPIKRNWGA
jgi:hypothetical protein